MKPTRIIAFGPDLILSFFLFLDCVIGLFKKSNTKREHTDRVEFR